jgi:ComF family protein
MSFINTLVFLAKKSLELVYPPHCRHCGVIIVSVHSLCGDCFKSIKLIASLKIPLTTTRDITIYAAAQYADPIKSFIMKKHYGDSTASYELAKLTTDLLNLEYLKADLLVPVPLHWLRYAQRGFNPAAIIAEGIANKLNVSMYDLTCRTKNTVLQASLTVEERVHNVTHVFSIKKQYQSKIKDLVEGKHLVLVDDLYTTGSTIKSLAKIFLPYKPQKISVIVTCRVP